MKKEDLKIEIGNLYELSDNRNVYRDMYSVLPKSKDEYIYGIKMNFLNLPKQFDDPGFYIEKENTIINTSPKKYIVMVKNVEWLNFCRNSIPKAAFNNAWLPVVEVYDIRNNNIFFVKPRVLIECRDGKDLNEIAQNNLNNLKQTLLTRLRAK